MSKTGDFFGKRLNITVPSFPFESLCEGAVKVLQHVRPDWVAENIQFKLFTDGHTNRLVGCYVSQSPSDVVLIRVYGKSTELFIDRETEVANMQLMQRAKLGSPVYCGFQNGLCYGFSSGDVLDENSVRDPVISMLIASEMSRMHSVEPDADYKQRAKTEPCIFPILRKYLTLIPDVLPERQDFQTDILTKERLDPEISILEQHLTQLGSPIVFCHNDLLLKNIIFDKTQAKVSFIDFEYAGPNYQAFDIGNHFCEFAGLDTYVPELYPDRDFQLPWLRKYLEEQQGASVSQFDVDVLFVQVNKFTLASHLMWGIWAIIQSAHSALDFDFLNYAYGRISQYHKQKDILLSLPFPKMNGPKH